MQPACAVSRTEHLPLADACCDAAWSQDALCHMEKPAVVAEAARVLRPGAVFAFTDFIARTPLTAEERATLAQLQGRIAAVERRLGSSGGKGRPGTKPAAATRATATAARLQRLYADAVAFQHADARVRRQAQRRFEQRLVRLCQRSADDPAAVQGRLCRALLRHLPERFVFVFVAEPAVPPENNAAERARPLVTARTIAGGTRSPQGTATRMALASLLGTARARGQDPLLACAALLTTGPL
jgi:SAM-dependent methyltransferase